MRENKKLKILFVGVLDVPWSTNIPMKKEFEREGHLVDDFHYRTIANQFASKKNIILDKFASRFLRTLYFKIHGRKEMNQILLNKIKTGNYDLVFLAKTDIVNYQIIPKINKYSKTWYFFMDPLAIAKKIHAHKYAKNCSRASATFSDVNEFFKKHGAKSIFLTQGVDEEIFYPKETKKEIDVVFVGTIDKKREKLVNYLIINNIGVVCFGKGWSNSEIFNEALVDQYRKARIILNICRKGTGFSIRVFQAMGTGSFMLSEYCSDLEKLFQRKKHLDWFMSKKECLELIKYYLSHEQEREIIAKQGAQFGLENYSWEKIIRKIIKTIQL